MRRTDPRLFAFYARFTHQATVGPFLSTLVWLAHQRRRFDRAA